MGDNRWLELLYNRRLELLCAHLSAAATSATPAAVPAASSSEIDPRAQERVCVVTGMNKGVGYQIAKRIGREKTKRWYVVACARDPAKGEVAVAQLISEGVPSSQIEFKQVDIDDQGSIDKFAAWFAEQSYGRDRRLCALINNAAIQIEAGAPDDPTFADQARPTLRTNFFQTVAMTEALTPYLSPTDGRIVFVSSMSGPQAWADTGRSVQQRLLAAEQQKQGAATGAKAEATELKAMAREFVAAAEASTASDGSDVSGGWAPTTYGTSKMLLIAYTRWLARRYATDPRTAGVRVNACCPGFCATDMTIRPGGVTSKGANMGEDRGQQSPVQGADTPIWLATLPAAAPHGGMFQDRQMMEAPGWW
jgi:NAD(P)-dependent dehydrogenase (short-subunit alcohol dehydrogenase family)